VVMSGPMHVDHKVVPLKARFYSTQQVWNQVITLLIFSGLTPMA